MRHFVISVVLVFWSLLSFGEILQPAIWGYKLSKDQVEVGEEVELIFNVKLEDTWHLYTADLDPEIGPLPTVFEFTSDPSYELIGDIQQFGVHKVYDEIWEADITYFSDKAEFRQKIKVLSTDLNISGRYEYQVCTTVDGMCISGSGEFDVKDIKASDSKNKSAKSDQEEASVVEQSKDDSPYSVDTSDTSKSQSLWGFAIVAFLAGLAGLLTPCVFPMIPMTVTFFSHDNDKKSTAIRNALVYGLSIIAIYTIAGTIVAKINGPEFANWLSTHWIPNIFFFVVFVVFALSFLGMFEIVLPSSWVNKVDQQADKGGLYGAFFMAFTLVLVSFSCTGPIVGSILVESAGGQILKPIVGMFSFSLAFAIPFTLFAIFPDWLNKLPKSGGWLNSVKVVLGFLELALGLKFLSVADQVYHWGILDREIYLALWIVIFALIGFYLLGKIRTNHDSVLEKVGVPRLLLSIITFSFVVYLIPGMFGAPLKGLAGYLPPMTTHDYNLPQLILQNNSSVSRQTSIYDLCEEPKYADMLHFPHGIKGYFDLQQGLTCAKKQNKPVFIDFTGHGCVNCREMEARVWSDSEVLKRLKNDYIVVALYVDEKTELPESEWYTSTFDNKVKKTIGKQNADFQITAFNNNAQPFYVLMDYNQNPLIASKAYDLNVQNFIDFLDQGKEEFKSVTSR
ncbi:cytochrome c biogenesis protein CcdA [Reichenbachiella sp. MALMAid0571]|uniref:protein-disulfide reductase DsbD family protein n=1 Tax=Reichenbachiella sp. MALMAid0571 TaxID=3143939 RepID=UPI0032E02109